MKGTQPIPLSTDTILSLGWRSKRPEKIVLMTTRAFPMKSMEPPMAGFTCSSWDSQKYWPKKFIAVRLEPMWKWTGSSRSAQTSQSGSQARLARSGEPRSWGSEVMFTPRSPSSEIRWASRTHPSMSQAGRIGMGRSRLLVRSGFRPESR